MRLFTGELIFLRGFVNDFLKSGRYSPEWVAGYFRNPRQAFSGISGRYWPEYLKRSNISLNKLTPILSALHYKLEFVKEKQIKAIKK